MITIITRIRKEAKEAVMRRKIEIEIKGLGSKAEDKELKLNIRSEQRTTDLMKKERLKNIDQDKKNSNSQSNQKEINQKDRSPINGKRACNFLM